jgi:hypothetical protein
LYVAILWLGFANIRRTRQFSNTTEEEQSLASALQASLAGYLVGSCFGSFAYHFFPYFLVAYTSTLYAIAAKGASQMLSSRSVASASVEPKHRDAQLGVVTGSDYQKGRAFGGAANSAGADLKHAPGTD